MTMRKIRNEGKITITKGEIPEPAPEKSVSTVQPTESTATTKSIERAETREERLAKIKERLKKERGG